MAYAVGDPLPQRMDAKAMQAAFGLKPSRFYELVAAGEFDAFELAFRVGGRRAWSGELVRRFFAGEAIPKRARVSARGGRDKRIA